MPRTFELDYVDIINHDGCWSWIGRQGGRQELALDTNGCLFEGTAVHEAIHALGFRHMQERHDRDDHVRIVWENIAPHHHEIFNIGSNFWYDDFDTPYDFLSVMHYTRNTFSMNGLDTVIPHNAAFLDVIGQDRMSDADVTRLNRMYLC